MNQLLYIICVYLLTACGSTGEKVKAIERESLKPKFDIRIEMVSTVSRLADYDEYNMPNATNYINRIHDLRLL